MLSIKDISKSYGTKEVLKDISINLKEGSCFGLIGPNGAWEVHSHENHCWDYYK